MARQLRGVGFCRKGGRVAAHRVDLSSGCLLLSQVRLEAAAAQAPNTPMTARVGGVRVAVRRVTRPARVPPPLCLARHALRGA